MGYYGHVRMYSDRPKLIKAIKNLLTKAGVRYETRALGYGVNEVISFIFLSNFKISQLEDFVSKEKLLKIKTKARSGMFLAEFG